MGPNGNHNVDVLLNLSELFSIVKQLFTTRFVLTDRFPVVKFGTCVNTT
ncbi:hypothetical protein L3N51_02082 [Metallosphaera sp. J1]|nr:hypothetical protein [Metallosphaera javensis (ex Hofmann et al. 2022)]BCS92675.1 MAG: hypothetical protein MjAS7_1283 [Metallosphaera javensis (ex Sakai et al. 2022)]